MHKYGYIIRDILKYFEVKYLDFTLKHLGKKTTLNVDETRLMEKILIIIEAGRRARGVRYINLSTFIYSLKTP